MRKKKSDIEKINIELRKIHKILSGSDEIPPLSSLDNRKWIYGDGGDFGREEYTSKINVNPGDDYSLKNLPALSPEKMTIRSPGGYFGGPNSMSQERQDYYGSLLDYL